MKLSRPMITGVAAVILVVVLGAAVQSSCKAGGREPTLYEKIVDTLKNMKSFETEAYVMYKSNNKTTTYKTFQQAKSTGEYRIEVTAPDSAAGNITVFDGKVISQYNKKTEGRISVGTTESMERSEILLTSFIKNYLADKEVAVAAGKLAETDETVLEAKIPGDNYYMATEKLWINNETMLPVELIIYDQDNVARIIVNYKDFKYNVKLDSDIFTVEKNS